MTLPDNTVFDGRASSNTVMQLNQCCSPLEPPTPVLDTLQLCAADRHRSLGQGVSDQGQRYQWRLPRGTYLLDRSYLGTPQGDRWIQVLARPEPVLTVTSEHSLNLLEAAYHLGNRHVALEITPTYLRLAADPVLLHLLRDHLQVTVTEEIAPFHPLAGAYHSSAHSH